MGISHTNQLVNFDGLKQTTAPGGGVDKAATMGLIQGVFASLQASEPTSEGQISFDQGQEGVRLAGSTEEAEVGDQNPAKAKTGAGLLAILKNLGLEGNGQGNGGELFTDDVSEQVALSGTADEREAGDTRAKKIASLSTGARHENGKAEVYAAASSPVQFDEGRFRTRVADGEQKLSPDYAENRELAVG